MEIAFRADASLEIGTGHVMRCLTLARSLRETGVACQFITRSLPGHMGDRIADEGFDLTLLPAPRGPAPDGPPAHARWAGVDWEQDAAETRAVLGAAPDWLVIDHYAFDARWQRATCPAGTKLMVIDDLADRPHVCDLLLDQNLGHDPRNYDGLVPDDCTRLIGPSYALLRPEFAEARGEALARAGESGTEAPDDLNGWDRCCGRDIGGTRCPARRPPARRSANQRYHGRAGAYVRKGPSLGEDNATADRGVRGCG